MDKVSSYVDVLSPFAVAAVVLASVLLFLLTPPRRRMQGALVLMVVWTTVGQLPELPGQSLAKPTVILAYLLVALAAYAHPGPRLRLPGEVLWYPVMGVFAVMFVLYVDQLLIALALRAHWLALVAAALMVSRTMVDRDTVDRVLRAISIGLMGAVLIAGTAIITQAARAFYLGRLDPYGANPNQIGVIFAAAIPLSLYQALRAQRAFMRWSAVAMTALAAALVVLTASRSSVVVAAVGVVPILLGGVRRAAATVVALGIAGMMVFGLVSGRAETPREESDLARLSSIDTTRYGLFVRYLDESIADRPIVGLLGTREKSVLADDDIGPHPHNAYLEMLYLGGLLYTLPMLLLAFLTLGAGIYVFRRRSELPYHPMSISIIVALLFAVYAHGFVNGSIYYPTTSWPFIHVLLSAFVLTIASGLRRFLSARARQARRGALVAAAAASMAVVAGGCGCGSDAKPSKASGAVRVDKVADGEPAVLCAVKLDGRDMGTEVRAAASSLGVPMLPIAYNWVVDPEKDGVFDDRNRRRFEKWVEENVPVDYTSVVAIDYEHPFWRELRSGKTTPDRFAEIGAVYREVMTFAKSLRPRAKWGFYGLPMRKYAKRDEAWRMRIREIGEQLLRDSDVVFPSIYDHRRGNRSGRDIEAIHDYMRMSLELAGQRPVYVFVRGRYVGPQLHGEWIDDTELSQHVAAALDTVHEVGGVQRRPAGVILWDAYNRDAREDWQSVDEQQAKQLRLLREVARGPRRPVRDAPDVAPQVDRRQDQGGAGVDNEDEDADEDEDEEDGDPAPPPSPAARRAR